MSFRRGRRPRRAPFSRGRRQRFILSNFTRFPAPISIPVKKSIMFQMRNYVAMSSDGSGVIAGIIPGNPNATLSSAFGSVALYPEWTNVAALFAGVEIVQLEVVIIPKYVETKGDVPGNVIVGTQFIVAGSFPNTYQTAADNQDSQSISITNDTSGRGTYHAMRWPRKPPSATNDPDPTGDSLIGAPGGISIYGSGMPITTSLIGIKIVGTYRLYARS